MFGDLDFKGPGFLGSIRTQAMRGFKGFIRGSPNVEDLLRGRDAPFHVSSKKEGT